MMTSDKYAEAKRILMKELGRDYPKTREDLTFEFLLKFANFIDAPDENDYGDDFQAYENAKYSSEQWTFINKMTNALLSKENGREPAVKALSNDYLNWVVKNYFPEFDR